MPLGYLYHGQCKARDGSLGVDVVERVDGRDASNEPGVVSERREGIDRLDEQAVSVPQDRDVVRRIHPRDHVRVRWRWREAPKRRPKGGICELGCTAATRHLLVHRRHPLVEVRGGVALGVENLEFAHERDVDPVLHATEQAALARPPTACADGPAVAGVQQGEEGGLGSKWDSEVGTVGHKQVVDEDRPGPHGVDPRAGKERTVGEHRAVAGREQARMVDHLERGAGADEATGVDRQAADPTEWMGLCARGPDGEVGGKLLAAGQLHRVGVDGHDPVASLKDDAPALEGPHHPPHAPRSAADARLSFRDQRDGVGPPPSLEASVHREGQLDPGRPRPDDHHRHGTGVVVGETGLDAAVEGVDGTGGYRVVEDTRKVRRGHGRPDVQAAGVVEDGRPFPVGVHAPLGRVDALCRREDDRGTGSAGEGDDVDRDVPRGVLARHVPGNHARVDGDGAIHHDGHVQLGSRLHHQSAQHLDVDVSATHQHEPLAGSCRLHTHLPYRTTGLYTMACRSGTDPPQAGGTEHRCPSRQHHVDLNGQPR